MKRKNKRDARGRLHLALHRDPVTGDEGLALEVPVFEGAWQNELAAGTANTAYRALGGEATLEATVDLARNVMAATSRLADGLLARAPAGAVACRAGCDHCCHQAVGVTPPEALAILDHVSRTFSDAELEAVAARVAERRRPDPGALGRRAILARPPLPFPAVRAVLHLRGPPAVLSRDELPRRR